MSPHTLQPLVVHDLAAGPAPAPCSSGLDLVAAPGRRVGLVGGERRPASPPCCALLAGTAEPD